MLLLVLNTVQSLFLVEDASVWAACVAPVHSACLAGLPQHHRDEEEKAQCFRECHF